MAKEEKKPGPPPRPPPLPVPPAPDPFAQLKPFEAESASEVIRGLTAFEGLEDEASSDPAADVAAAAVADVPEPAEVLPPSTLKVTVGQPLSASLEEVTRPPPPAIAPVTASPAPFEVPRRLEITPSVILSPDALDAVFPTEISGPMLGELPVLSLEKPPPALRPEPLGEDEPTRELERPILPDTDDSPTRPYAASMQPDPPEPSRRWGRMLPWGVAAMVVISVASGAAIFLAPRPGSRPAMTMYLVSEEPLLSRPEARAEPLAGGTLGRGAQVTRVAESGAFALVQDRQARAGYLPKAALTAALDASPCLPWSQEIGSAGCEARAKALLTDCVEACPEASKAACAQSCGDRYSLCVDSCAKPR